MNLEINKNAMSYGLLFGIIFSINFYITTVPAIAFLQYLVAIFIIVFTYKLTVKCRDKICGGAITYGRALFYVVQLYSYAALILAFFKYIFYTYLAPDFLKKQLDMGMQVLEESGMADSFANYDQVVDMAEKILTPLNFSLQAIWANVFTGLFLGLIIAAMVKKDKSIFEDNQLENE